MQRAVPTGSSVRRQGWSCSCTVLGRRRDAALRWTTWSSRRPLCDAAVRTLQQRSSARLYGTGDDRWMNAQLAAC